MINELNSLKAKDESTHASETLDSLPKIIRKIPRSCFELKVNKSLLSLIFDFCLAGTLAWCILYFGHWAIALPLALILGTVMTGLFVLGHDAAHRSFSYSERLNDIVGHIAMAPVLWPFHVWRLSHDVHHRFTHHVEKEIAWRPLTLDQYQKLPPSFRKIYGWSRSTVFFWASILFQFSYVLDALQGRFFDGRDRQKINFSLGFSLVTAIFYIGLTFVLGGWFGFFWLFVVPQLAFHFWLSTFTLFHHTNQKNKVMSAQLWTPEKAQLANTVHVHYHWIIDFLTHDISWHVPHHVCVGIPFYNLRKAHSTLKLAYPEWVVERTFGPDLIREVMSTCHLVAGTQPGQQEWLSIGEIASMEQRAGQARSR